ncbi:MAG TPA: hypothetical protein VFS38_05645 [Actinomycetota bacterium]|nr:hypothetical protein [Actinomycetota bacterium]
MNSALLAVIVVIVALILFALLILSTVRRRRSDTLRQHYGPEYDLAIQHSNGKVEAETELMARSTRREELDIRPLDSEARERFSAAWFEAKADFVDDPDRAIAKADELVQEVMRERGYPIDGFEQQAADVSVGHPDVVSQYRSAHAIAVARGKGEASTEESRQAMIHYRAMFEELVGSA